MAPKVTTVQAITALLLLVPIPSIGSAVALWLTPGPVGQSVYAAAKLWILVLPLAWYFLVERRGPLSETLGGALRPRLRGLTFGLISGVAIAAAIVSLIVIFVLPRLDTQRLRLLAADAGLARPAVYLAFAAYLTFVNALLEEYVWRWFVYRQWERLVPPVAAIAAAAVCFTLHHVIVLRSFAPWGLALLGASGVFVGGIVWSWAFRRYRSIWPGYLSHIIADAAILALGWRLLFLN